jgi:ABC-2 type transport system permease protein
MAAIAAPQPVVTLRRGVPYWLDSYWALTRWHLAGLRMWVMLLVVIQIMAGAGFVLGIGLFFAHIPAIVALYVCTGVPVINLIMIGLILGPQLVAEQKLQQSYDFVRSLPVPQTAAAMAWYTVCLLAGLPAVVVSLLIAEARYGISLTVSPAIVPAVLLTAFTGTMIGYGLGHAVPNPMVTQLVTQLLVFAIFGFTPILFPAWQLPHWLATLNWWLPFGHMAVIVRDGLTAGLVTGVASSYLIVAAWAGLGSAAAAWALGRRG